PSSFALTCHPPVLQRLPFSSYETCPGGSEPKASWWLKIARLNWRSRFEHSIRRADSRAIWIAGSSNAISTAMIAITTNSSISVKPERRRRERNELIIIFLLRKRLSKSGDIGSTAHAFCRTQSKAQQPRRRFGD